MVFSKKYQNKNIAIYGMGLTGFSAAKILKKLGAKIFCWDDNIKIRKKIKNLKFTTDKFWLNQKIVDNIVISPGIDINKCRIKNYLKKNSNKIITDLDLFFEFNKDTTVISITGTNGKSTTCKIIEKILRNSNYYVKTLGNIGNPILFFDEKKKPDVVIIEASSYQLQYSKLFRSKHAAILNISPDHLERHKNIKTYTKVKSKIFLAQKNSDYSYINLEDKYAKIIKNIFKTKRVKSKLIQIKKNDCNLLIKKISNRYFQSKGYIENIAFCYRIAKNFGISESIIVKSINRFKGLPHRQEVIFSNKRLTCVNDSKATSFDACLQSLLNYNNIYWIVGGLPKNRDHFNLKKVSEKIIKTYIIGKNTLFFKKQIKNDVSYKISNNLKKAVNDVYEDIKRNKNSKNTILFSPAAASFDQFKNFEERGNYFKKMIKNKLN